MKQSYILAILASQVVISIVVSIATFNQMQNRAIAERAKQDAYGLVGIAIDCKELVQLPNHALKDVWFSEFVKSGATDSSNADLFWHYFEEAVERKCGKVNE